MCQKDAIKMLYKHHAKEMQEFTVRRNQYITAHGNLSSACLVHLENMHHYHRGAINALKQIQGEENDTSLL